MILITNSAYRFLKRNKFLFFLFDCWTNTEDSSLLYEMLTDKQSLLTFQTTWDSLAHNIDKYTPKLT